jgi:thiol-disulfide isomerase/thioredoxin
MNLKNIGLAAGLVLLAGGGLAMSKFAGSCGSCASEPVAALVASEAQGKSCGSTCSRAVQAQEVEAIPTVGTVAFAPEAASARAADIYVVAFHAEWCPKCKVLEPKVKELKKSLAGKPVLWTGVDRTDRDSAQAEYTVSALGMGDLWAEHGKGPGFALIVKASDRSVLGTLKSDASVEDMTKAVEAALKQAK